MVLMFFPLHYGVMFWRKIDAAKEKFPATYSHPLVLSYSWLLRGPQNKYFGDKFGLVISSQGQPESLQDLNSEDVKALQISLHRGYICYKDHGFDPRLDVKIEIFKRMRSLLGM